jgi:HlyD family secretion protein
MMKTLFGLLVAATIGGLLGFHYWHGGSAELPKFRTVSITRGDLPIVVGATGTVEPLEIIDVGAQILGSIKSFGPDPDRPGKTIDYRSRVEAGSVLAQLDDLPHLAARDNASANVKLCKADVDRARSKQKQAESDFHRAERLKQTNAMAAADFEKAQAAHEVALADLAANEAKLEQAEIALKQAEINLSYTVIKSPVNGVVIDRRVNVGQTVVAGMNAPSLFLLARDLGHMLVWSAVNEADIGDISVGQKVTFKVDAYRERTFVGKVSQVRLNASLISNVVTYPVVVDVDNSDGKLMPYMTAKLQFEVARHADVVKIPNQALHWRPTWTQVSPAARVGLTPPPAGRVRQGEPKAGEEEEAEPTVDVIAPTVWVPTADGLVRPVEVQVGLSDDMETELTGGELLPGMAVVVNVVREAKPDFVSGFISKVTNTSH